MVVELLFALLFLFVIIVLIVQSLIERAMKHFKVENELKIKELEYEIEKLKQFINQKENLCSGSCSVFMLSLCRLYYRGNN